MSHRMDPESQATLRRQKQSREESNKKNNQAREKQRVETQSFIPAQGSSDIPRLPAIKETSINEGSGSKRGSATKSGNKPDLKLPPLDTGSIKQKLKNNTSSKKAEKSALDPNTSGLGVQPDSVRKSIRIGSEDGKPSPRRSSGLNLGLNHRGLEIKPKTGPVPAQAQPNLPFLSPLDSQGATDPSGTYLPKPPPLLPRRKALLRSREKSFSSHSGGLEEPPKEMEENEDPNQLKKNPSLNNNQLPGILDQGNKLREICLERGKRGGMEGGNERNSSARGKSSHRVLREPRVMTERDREGQRDRFCPGLEEADYSQLEYISRNVSIQKMLNNVNYYRGRASSYTYCKEWYSASHQKCPGSWEISTFPEIPAPPSSLASTQRPNTPASGGSPPTTPEILNLCPSPAPTMKTTSSLRSFMGSAGSESSDSLSSEVSSPEEGSTSATSSSGNAFYIMENLFGSAETCSSLDSSSSETDPHISYFLHDHLPLSSLVFPHFPSQRPQQVNNSARNPPTPPSASKEKGKRPQKKPKGHTSSFPAENSEEEGDHCRICQIAGSSPTNPLLEPCGCMGSLQFICQQCLKKWIQAKIKSGAEMDDVMSCELCKQQLTPEVADFILGAHYKLKEPVWICLPRS